MYRFNIDYFDWDRLPERSPRDNAFSIAAEESTPKLKNVLLEIAITLGVALTFAFVAELALRLAAIT
jgi:hypothetical protein